MKNQQNNSKYLGHDYRDKGTDSARLIQSVRNFYSLLGKGGSNE